MFCMILFERMVKRVQHLCCLEEVASDVSDSPSLKPSLRDRADRFDAFCCVDSSSSAHGNFCIARSHNIENPWSNGPPHSSNFHTGKGLSEMDCMTVRDETYVSWCLHEQRRTKAIAGEQRKHKQSQEDINKNGYINTRDPLSPGMQGEAPSEPYHLWRVGTSQLRLNRKGL